MERGFISSIKTIFEGMETCVSNAGYTSKYFAPSNGVHQGCCVSPLLFAITVKLLAIMIRCHRDIQGVKVHDTELRVSQFADDTTCFVGTRDSLHMVIDTVARFGLFSGLQLNMDKCLVLPLGSAGTHRPHLGDLQYSDKIKVLGIWFSVNLSLQDHYDSSWSNRSLSIKGKITVFNSLIISMVQYVCANTVTPPCVPTELTKLARSFIWGGKQSKVAYATLIQSIQEGGLNVMDLASRVNVCLLRWVKHMLDNP